MFDLAALDASLSGTIFAGKLHYSAVTDSTNLDALEAARSGAAHGSVYLANAQRAGRGRADHAWQSAAGEGLYVSILLRSSIPAVQQSLLPLVAGLAAMEAIHAISGIAADLRWPNDLLIGNRKVGGILLESKIENSKVAFAVFGIGINVHQRSFAPDLSTAATSLDLEADFSISRQRLLLALLKSLEQATTGPLDSATILKRVEQLSTWMRGRNIQVHGPQACTGTTEGLNQHGFLRVRTAGGIVTVQTGGIRNLEIQEPSCS